MATKFLLDGYRLVDATEQVAELALELIASKAEHADMKHRVEELEKTLREEREAESKAYRRVEKLMGTIVVLIDASGSISDELFKEYWAQAQEIVRSHNDVAVGQFSNGIQWELSPEDSKYERESFLKSLPIRRFHEGTDLRFVMQEVGKMEGIAEIRLLTDGRF